MSYRAGIIGTGGIAGLGILGLHDPESIGREKFQTSHAGGYEAADGIELVAAADVDETKLRRFGDVWEIAEEHRYERVTDMLASEPLDVVSVCSPTYLHHDHVIEAAESTADPDVIWCEKPIASSLADAEEMADVCEETGTELVVNHSFRFAYKIQTLKGHIEDGLLGDVRSISANFRRELLRNSTHLLDTVLFLTGGRARRVSGYINGENDAVDALEGDRQVADSGGGGHVVLDDGTFVTVDCTVSREISSMSLLFTGTDGKLYLNNDDGEWRYWTLAESGHVEREIPGVDGSWDWSVDYRDAFQHAATHVVDLVDGTAANLSSGQEATRSLEIIIGFYLSHYLGTEVTVPVEQPLRSVTITSW